MIKIPQTINILGMDFEIKYTEIPRVHKRGAGCYATIDNGKNIIELEEGNHGQKHLSSLLHEIVHQISNELDISLTESQVSTVSTGMFTVLRANSELDFKAIGE